MTDQAALENGKTSDDILWRQLKTLPAFRALLRAVETRFYDKVDMPQPVLDVGCGDGHFAQMAFDCPLRVGIDPWWGPLNKAVESGVYDLPLQAMGDKLPFPDHCFASAFSNSVLEHIPDIQPVLNEIGRVLQPEAPFIITVPSHHFSEYLGGAEFFDRVRLEGMAGRYRDLFNRISRHAHTDAPDVWAERLAQAGFTIERWQYYFSREALHALEIGHAQGLPSAVLHALTGHWIIGPYESNLKWTERWVRPFYEEEFPEKGAYIFFLARKASDTPLPAEFPAAKPFTVSELEQEEVINLTDSAAAIASLPSTRINLDGNDESGGLIGPASTALEADDSLSTQDSKNPPKTGNAPRRRWLYLVAILLAFLAPQIAGPGSSMRPTAAIIIWLAASALAFFALLQPGTKKEGNPLVISRFTVASSILLFITALLIRLYDLEQHPFILNGTEASMGLDALGVINGSIGNPFRTAWLTNPTLPLFLLAIPIRFLGASVMALRLVSPTMGAITVVATFLVGQRLYGRVIGLSSAVLLLGSYFHVHYSRLGLTNAWDALLILLSIGFIAMAWQGEPARNRLAWLLAGLAVGFSAYLYTSSRLLPIMLLGLALLTLVIDRQNWRRQWRNILAMAGLALVIALPQLIFYGANPGIFMERANALGILANQSGWLTREAAQTDSSLMQLLGQQLWSAALAFNATLDSGTSFGPQKPLMNLLAGLLFILGFVLAFIRSRRIQYGMLIIWIVTTIVFAGALLIGPPNSHRYIIAAPAANLLAAIGLVELIAILFKRSDEDQAQENGGVAWYQHKVAPLLVALLFTVAIAIYDTDYYFGSYRDQHRFADRNTEIADVMAHYLNSLEGDWSAYFYGPPNMYVDFPSITFLASSYQKNLNLFDVEEIGSELPAQNSSQQVFIYLPERYDEIDYAKSNFPAGEEKQFDGYYAQPLLHVYEVKD